jgi:hypothetical protein
MLRLIDTLGSLPASFKVDLHSEFQPGMLAQINEDGTCGVSNGIAPIGIIDDVRTRTFRSVSWDEVHLVVIDAQRTEDDQLLTVKDTIATLDHTHIDPDSFASSVYVVLNAVNGTITIPAGTKLNFDMFGTATPNGVKLTVSYTYQVPNLAPDDSTLGSNRMTVWTQGVVFQTDQFETTTTYEIGAKLYCSEHGIFTTRVPSPEHPCIGIVSGMDKGLLAVKYFGQSQYIPQTPVRKSLDYHYIPRRQSTDTSKTKQRRFKVIDRAVKKAREELEEPLMTIRPKTPTVLPSLPYQGIARRAARNMDMLIGLLKARLNSTGKTQTTDQYGNVSYVDSDVFTQEQLEAFITLSLSEFNATPAFTNYSLVNDGFVNLFSAILVEGAAIQALGAQALIEKGREHTFTEKGFSFTPPDISNMLNSQFQTLLHPHIETLKHIKSHDMPDFDDILSEIEEQTEEKATEETEETATGSLLSSATMIVGAAIANGLLNAATNKTTARVVDDINIETTSEEQLGEAHI